MDLLSLPGWLAAHSECVVRTSPHPRQQSVAYPLTVFPVAWEVVGKELFFVE